MSLIRLVYRQYRREFLLMLGFTALSGLLGIATLAYINRFLLAGRAQAEPAALWRFAGIIILYFSLAAYAQYQLAKLGQRFIYRMQTRLLKQILDSDEIRIQTAGKARILASLSGDIRTMSFAFTRLPEMVQGLLFSIACSIYLLSISVKLFALTAALIALMLIGSHLLLMHHHRQFRQMRRADDDIYRHYQTALDGHKELLLNRPRAQRFFEEDFSQAIDRKHRFHLKGDLCNALSSNWSNSMMLAAVGLIFYLAVYQGWASVNEAAGISMTVLFMRAPLTAAIGALPALMQSEVAVQALEQLSLPPYQSGFAAPATLPPDWQSIRLQELAYRHPEQGGQSFAVQDINLSIRRGETLFIIGANGSGKSTLSMLLSGLYAPDSGRILLDGIPITAENRPAYRQLFSSVFTDFHLFEQLLDGEGRNPPQALLDEWLTHLQLGDKVLTDKQRLLNAKLSQGQKKRLALLAATLENRSILLLDEWAADQDPQFRRLFYEHLLPLLKARGHTLIAISHDDRYFQHADRIVAMENGRLREYDPQQARTAVAAQRQSPSQPQTF